MSIDSGATADQTKSDIDALGIAASILMDTSYCPQLGDEFSLMVQQIFL